MCVYVRNLRRVEATLCIVDGIRNIGTLSAPSGSGSGEICALCDIHGCVSRAPVRSSTQFSGFPRQFCVTGTPPSPTLSLFARECAKVQSSPPYYLSMTFYSTSPVWTARSASPLDEGWRRATGGENIAGSTHMSSHRHPQQRQSTNYISRYMGCHRPLSRIMDLHSPPGVPSTE